MIRESYGRLAAYNFVRYDDDDGPQYGWGLRAQCIPTIDDVLAADRWRLHDMLGVWSGAIGVAVSPPLFDRENAASWQRAYRTRKKQNDRLKGRRL